MMKKYRRPSLVFAGASALMMSCLQAAAHPGLHIGADHSHFFGGGELLPLVAVVGVAIMLLYHRKG